MSGRSGDVSGRTKLTVLAQETVTADGQSTSVDVTELSGNGRLVFVFGVPNNADNTIEAQLQESSDDGSSDAFADVAGATSGPRTSDVAETVVINDVDFDALESDVQIDFKGVAGTGVSYEVAVIALSSGHVLPTG